MKKRIILISLIVLCILSSCSQTPDNIQGNNHNVDLNSENNKVSVKHILDDFDEAFETKYSKFSLPEKSKVIINQPEKVCDLQLDFLNKKKSLEWMSQKLSDLQTAFEHKIDGEIVVDETIVQIGSDNENVSVSGYSEPYSLWNFNSDVISYVNQNVVETEVVYIDRIPEKNIDGGLKSAMNKAINYAQNVKNVMKDELDVKLATGYILHGSDDLSYEIDLQKTYKGIGIMNLPPAYVNDYTTKEGTEILTTYFETYIEFDSSLNPLFYNSCDCFTIKSEKDLHKIISLKGACDILEKELGNNLNLQFDDMELMYEPQEYISSENDTIEKHIQCVPKWFFMIDYSEGIQHMLKYISVDCVTGKIEVVL